MTETRSIRNRLGITDADLSLSNGRLYKFKTRHRIKLHTLHGESHSVGRVSLAVSQYELQDLIAQCNSDDVFNLDESALLYRITSDKTLASVGRHGSATEKYRFEGEAATSVPTSQDFSNAIPIFLQFDRVAESNHVCHLASAFQPRNERPQGSSTSGNASSHTVNYVCRNVTIKFLPPNMTSLTQPLNAGKQYGITALTAYQLLSQRSKLDGLEGMQFAIASWVEVPAQENDYGRALDASVEEDLAALMTECVLLTDVIERVGLDADQESDNYSEAEAQYHHQRLWLAVSSVQSLLLVIPTATKRHEL
ncbi:major centromere autoantigen b [Plasmopara halstedii]|uniref:Major centromere autoantigen b n=1 Tax=Plasmopara halstedii TaxID=4781 RepID=A0A0P1A9Q1_PLAHL|nr:major centromere autoantigen b [Plasmopara halstedii]CEG37202.1 major centromere autoantigen b [Plasmopara halstedii]|eukprot:XP_024573571.1 major centromere autoantigen b [Plasmopara halstedii]